MSQNTTTPWILGSMALDRRPPVNLARWPKTLWPLGDWTQWTQGTRTRWRLQCKLIQITLRGMTQVHAYLVAIVLVSGVPSKGGNFRDI
jgi:hypothetical protein